LLYVGVIEVIVSSKTSIHQYNKKEATSGFPLRNVAASMVDSIKEVFMLRARLESEIDELLQPSMPDTDVNHEWHSQFVDLTPSFLYNVMLPALTSSNMGFCNDSKD
jgi:hypothetical protein